MDGSVIMTLNNRLMLFLLSSLSTVIVPAVMISFWHTVAAEVSPANRVAITAVGIVPLFLIMVICFVGLYYSIFRVKTTRNERP